MSQNDIALLSHDDITIVKQGLEALGKDINDEEDLRKYISYPPDCDNVEALHRFLEGLDWRHHNYIKLWILGLLSRLRVAWVLEIRRLDLSFNELVELPNTIENLTHLTHLWLNGNPLEHIPISTLYLHNLKQLDLRGLDVHKLQLSDLELKHIVYDKDTLWPEGVNPQNDLASYINPNSSLSKSYLEHANLSGVNLNHTHLGFASLRNANLSGADLSQTNLCFANLLGANLSGADLSQADLSNAVYDKETQWPEGFEYQKSGAYYIGPKSNLGSSLLCADNLSSADLSGADLSNIRLVRTDLRDANLGRANLKEIDLHQVDLRRADLSGADLSQAKLEQTLYDKETIWPEGFDYQNKGMYYIGPNANLISASLDSRDLSDSNLRGAELSKANLIESNLSQTDLSSANLSGAALSYADLSGADLGSANLSDADLIGAELSHANLDEANLEDAIYDEDTVWPEGFDPKEAGAWLERDSEDSEAASEE